jgi:ribosomal protein L21
MYRTPDMSGQKHEDVDHTVPTLQEFKPAPGTVTDKGVVGSRMITDEPWSEKHVGRSDTKNGDVVPVSEVHVGATPQVQVSAPTALSPAEIINRLKERRKGMRVAVEGHKARVKIERQQGLR